MKQLDFTGGMPESETKTLVVFVDCHASHNVEIRVNEYYERMFRSFCKRYGYKCCTRSKRTEARSRLRGNDGRMMEEQERTEAATSAPLSVRTTEWRKVDGLMQRRKAIHDRLVASAFDLSVRTSMEKGGWA